jgi:hypothetical protein
MAISKKGLLIVGDDELHTTTVRVSEEERMMVVSHD